MRTFDITRRSARNLRQARARTILTSLAIGVGAFALTLTLAASNGAQQYVNKVIADNFDPAELIVAKDKAVVGRGDATEPREYDESYGTVTSNAGAAIQAKQLTEEDVEKIRSYTGIEQLREGVALSFQYITGPNGRKYVANAGDLSPAQNPETVAGSIGKPLTDNNVLLPEAYIKVLGFKSAGDAIGKEITVAVRRTVNEATLTNNLPSSVDEVKEIARNSTVERKLTVAAVLKKQTAVQPGTEIYLYVNNDTAKSLNDIATENTPQYRKYLSANVRVKDGTDPAKLKAVQDQLKKDGYYSLSVEETQKFLTQIIDVLKGIVAAFGFIAVVASVFGVINTMYISVLQRTREIGLMKALGMRKKDISRLFRFEAAWIGFLGGLMGSGIAYGLGVLANPTITKQLELGSQKLLIFDLKQMVVLILALMLVAIFAGLLPARKAAKLDPIEALRTE